MERRRTYGIMGGVVLTLALVAMISITYATFNKTLNINGAGTVNAQKWDIHFDTSSLQKSTTGTATATVPTVNATSIGNYTATFSTPGDSVTYTFKVVNSGTFNASISSVNVPTPTVTGTGTNKANDEANVSGKLSYQLLNSDNSAVAVGQTLAKDGGEKTMKLILTYQTFDDATLLPQNDVTISNLAVSLTYQQAS